MKRLSAALLAGAALFALPTVANAANSPPASICGLGDINLHIGAAVYAPIACKADIQTGANDPTTETTALNAAFPGNGLLFLAKDDGSSSAGLQGIKFTLDTPTGLTWNVSWTDTNGAASQNLPVLIDFAVLINGGNNGSGYLFNDVLLPEPPNNSGGGSFAITFFNNGGQHPGLSHMIMVGADIHSPPPPPPCTSNCGPPDPRAVVPEPASMALLGMGVLGLAVARRRRT